MDTVHNGGLGTAHNNTLELSAKDTDPQERIKMGLDLIMRVAGMGMLVSVACQILSKIGKDDTSSLVSLGGIIAILIVLFGEVASLFDTVRGIFGI